MNRKLITGVMITAILLLSGAINLKGETPRPQSVLITVNQSGSRLEQVLNDIEKQSDYLFVYNKLVDVRRNVTLNVSGLPIDDALRQLFGGTDIGFEIEGSYVILSYNGNKKAPTPPLL
jgi:hypothetical protein